MVSEQFFSYIIVRKKLKLHSAKDHMVNLLALSVVDCEFKPWMGGTKDNKIDLCCFSTKHLHLRNKSKNWLAQNQNNVVVWSFVLTDVLYIPTQKCVPCHHTK
jgi:hypothetical protein